MGYSFFNIIQLKDNFKRKLNSFVTSLGPAIKDGKKISFADNDIGYVLDLQHKRIKSKGLDIEYDLYDRDEKSGAIVGSEWKDSRYESYVCNEQYGVLRKISKDGKKLYSDKKRNILYTTITDTISGVHPDDETIACPNCGNVSTIAQVQGGCPYCGTVYKMDDLFPKVTSYYFLEDVGIAGDEHKVGMRISMLITTVALELLIYITSFIRGDYDKLGLILGSIFLIPLGVLFGYMIYSFYLLIRLIAVGSSQSSGKWGTIGSRKRFEQKMKSISPEFSFEYFTSKAISLIKTAVYSPDEQELLFYKGAPLSPELKDVIDMNYGGALGFTGLEVDNGQVTVVTDAFFDVLYADENKIFSRREVFKAVFRRRIDIPFNTQFSMTKIQCPSCAGSFNAVMKKNCPFCGNEYKIESQDWILTELIRK